MGSPLTTSTWTGSSKTAWNNTAFWSAGAVPDSGTVAVIDASHVLTVNGAVGGGEMTVAELDVSGVLNIASGGYLLATTAAGGSGALDMLGGTVNFTTTGGELELQGGILGPATIGFGTTTTNGLLYWNTTSTIGSSLTLDNFFVGDELDITTTSWDHTLVYDPTTHTLSLGGVGTVSLAHSLTPGERDYATSDFNVATSAGKIAVTDSYPCFLRGTRIATLRGEVAVEDLRIGDLVMTTVNEARPVVWVGRLTVSRVFANPLRVLPIRIEAGALGENLPARDLLISPDHALLLGGVLIQAGALVNGTTIRREQGVAEVFTYYHVELEDHALILAEGMPAETFVDNIDRMAFDNWEEHLARWPDGRLIDELPLPRAKSARQVPPAVRELVAQRAAGKVSTAA